jgi:hypothetical protein
VGAATRQDALGSGAVEIVERQASNSSEDSDVGKLITDAYETLAPIATLLVWADDLADDDYTTLASSSGGCRNSSNDRTPCLYLKRRGRRSPSRVAASVPPRASESSPRCNLLRARHMRPSVARSKRAAASWAEIRLTELLLRSPAISTRVHRSPRSRNSRVATGILGREVAEARSARPQAA